MQLICLTLAVCIALASGAMEMAPAPAPIGAEALSGIAGFPQPNTLGYINNFFHPHTGPIAPGQGFLPLGNLLTSDFGGPYNLSLLSVQENEIKAGIAAKQNFTDIDIIRFLTNVECLEGLFDTWGTFGHGFIQNLELGGPTPIGARAAALTEATRPFLQEIALNEQGHALFTRQAGSTDPCPLVDFDGGFNAFMAAAYNLPPGVTVAARFGAPFNPFLNDQNFVLSVLTLEELGATGNKGLIALTTNPVLANGIAGLATSATAHAAVERFLLYQLRNTIIQPFGETAQQVFARISALRDSLDGPQLDDQGLVQTDPRNIAVPDGFVNMIPTDIRGLTFARTPQMNINILTLGSPTGTGVFFPNGLNGVIKTPAGFNLQDPGTASFYKAVPSGQETVEQLGPVSPPITGPTPATVPGQTQLSEANTAVRDDGLPGGRGLNPLPTTFTVNSK